MKLRIQGQSIRLRLTQREVAKLVAEGNVSESVRFSSRERDQFTYTLEARQGASTVSASYSDGHVRVTVPMPSAKKWANTDDVGIEQTEVVCEGTELSITIEKDFRCLQPRPQDDESDNFPNPEQNAKCA
jgi:hypothetical protein